MVTLRHPTFPKVTVDVEIQCVPGWVASGWLDERTPDDCCGDGPDDFCVGCPAGTPAEPPVKILPAPKPGPKKPPR